jgi:PAT family beta-lactamase induction signal transducer AmpG
VVLYKLSDNLTQNLTRPFFIQLGAASIDYGFGTQTVGQIAAILGAMVGAVLTDRIGLGRALWMFGVLQIVSNLGYAVLAETGPNRAVLYLSHAFEHITTGLGTGAFSVLLLRLTAKRFSATQYALLSSLFTIPRVFTGPAIGVYVNAIGWRDFFILTVFTGIPGLFMLARFVPWGVRDVEFAVAPPGHSRGVRREAAAVWGLLAGVSAAVLGFLLLAAPEAYRLHRAGTRDAIGAALRFMLLPPDLRGWIRAGSVWLLSLMVGVAAAAALLARGGAEPGNGPSPEGVESKEEGTRKG